MFNIRERLFCYYDGEGLHVRLKIKENQSVEKDNKFVAIFAHLSLCHFVTKRTQEKRTP